MHTPGKLFWAEGLFLRPQHFQQQDRYHEARLHQTSRALHPYAWGVEHIEWDLGALQNNTLRLRALRAIFPDGEPFDAPASAPLPVPVDLSLLPTEVQEVTYYAALPALAGQGGNCADAALPARAAVRFLRSDRDTADLYTQAASTEVAYLHGAVQLVAQDAPRADYDCFAVIHLRRLTSGGFEADPAFIAPSLSIAAAPRLQQLLAQLMDALLAKADSLHEQQREPSKNVIAFRSADVSSFWLLHTVSGAAATLMHYVRHPALHPERLYEAMLHLAGGLLSYARHTTLADLPAYVHAQPGPAFTALERIIRELLATVISAKYFAIPLDNGKPPYYLGQLDSGKIDQETRLYLALRAAMKATELVEVTPLRVKVGAPDDVEKCVLSALPGVKLTHAPQVPAALPVRPDTYYFALDRHSTLYATMLKAQAIAIYVPSGIAELELELLAVTA